MLPSAEQLTAKALPARRSNIFLPALSMRSDAINVTTTCIVPGTERGEPSYRNSGFPTFDSIC